MTAKLDKHPLTLPARDATPMRCAVLAVALLMSLTARSQEPEPIPIRRQLLNRDMVPATLGRGGNDALVPIPRAEFEALFKQATSVSDPPKLVETRYSARLDGDALTGSAEWKILNSARIGRLSLDPLYLALRQIRWPDNHPALIGLLDNKPGAGLELFVDRPGASSLTLDWSARGVPETAGTRFDFRVPSSPIAVLELDLPVDREPQVDRDAVVMSGPAPATAADRRIWRIAMGGQSRVNILVRHPASANRPGALIHALVSSIYRLTPGQLDAEFEFDLTIPRGELRELQVECDAPLRPFEVNVLGMAGWDLLPAVAGKPVRLRVRFREPFRGGRLTLRATAPVPLHDPPWSCPVARVDRALPRSETIALHIHPDLKLENWSAGAFRLTAIRTAADRTQVLTLQPIAGGASRPTMRLRPLGAVFDARQNVEWRIDPDGMRLTAKTGYRLRHGTLFQLSFLIPGGWEVEQLETSPADPGLRWSVNTADPRMLTVEPLRPFNQAGERTLTVRLRAPLPKVDDATGIPFPDLWPRGANRREGDYGIAISPAYVASAVSELAPSSTPDLRFQLRGSPVMGTLRLQPRPLVVESSCDTTLTMLRQSARIDHRLQLQSRSGDLSSIVIRLPSASWTASVSRGDAKLTTWEPAIERDAATTVALLGTFSPWEFAVRRLALDSTDSWWRATFDPPIRDRGELDLSAEVAATSNGISLLSPVPAGAEPSGGSVTVWHSPSIRWTLAGTGLQPDVLPQSDAAMIGRRVRFTGSPVLTLRPESADDSAAQIDRAVLTIVPSTDGPPLFHLAFRVGRWPWPEFPIELPAGARLSAVRVAGHDVSAVPQAGDRVSLPWPASPLWVDAELTYTLPGDPWRFVTRIEAPSPRLPIKVTLRRIWRLTSGLSVADRSGFLPLSGENGGEPWLSWARQATFDPRQQHQAMLAAANAWQRAVAEQGDERLGTALVRLALDHLTPAEPLIIDASALRAEGLTPQSPLPVTVADSPFWKTAGLVHVACRSGALLTTLSERQRWEATVPEWVEAGVARAVAAGHDAGNRFQTVLDWVQSEPAGAGASPRLAVPDEPFTEWEAAEEIDSITLVESGAMRAGGIALAALLLGVCVVVFARGWRGRWLILLAWPALAGAAIHGLPEGAGDLARWPLLAGMVAAIIGVCLLLIQRPRSNVAPAVAGKPASIVRVVVLLGWAGLAGQAAPPNPVTVYLLPGPPDDPEPRTVLAPANLLDRLRELTRRGQPTAGIVILSAHYDGRATDAGAWFEARYRLHAVNETPAALLLPVTGVQLQEAILDGAAAFPRPGPGADQFQIDVKGQGSHDLVLRFAVATPAGDDREVSFAIPEVATTRLTFVAPTGAGRVYTPLRRGSQQETLTPAGRRLEADLGRTTALVVRWRSPDATSTPPINVQEMALWDQSDQSLRLWSVLRYRIGPGRVASIDIDVPPGLEVASVEARALNLPAGLSPTGVSNWFWQDATRNRLKVIFREPVTGSVQILIDCLVLAPFEGLLAAPSAVGITDRETFLAVRSISDSLTVTESRGVRPLPVDEFLRNHWRPARVESDPRPPSLAFQADATVRPEIRLSSRMPAPTGAGRQEIEWQVGPDRAEVRASAHWTGLSVGLVEWTAPSAIAIESLQGRELRAWSRNGNRVQAWVDLPASGSVTLELTGRLPQPAGTGERRFDMPSLTLPGLAEQQAMIRISPRAGWRLMPHKLHDLRELPNSDLPGFHWTGVTERPDGPNSFRVVPAAGRGQAAIQTSVSATGTDLSIQSKVDLNVTGSAAGPNTIQVQVRKAEGFILRLTIPPGARIRDERRRHDGMIWEVDLPQGSHQLTLAGSRSLAMAREWWVPRLTVQPVGGQSNGGGHIVALAEGLRGASASGLQSLGPNSWRVTADDWNLRVRPISTRMAGRPSAEVSLAELTIAQDSAQGNWLEATYQIRHETGAEFVADCPAGRLVAVSWQGREMPAPATSSRWHGWIPTAMEVGELRLVWHLGHNEPSAPALSWDGEPMRPKVTLWGIATPPGLRATLASPAWPAVVAGLYRAEQEIRAAQQWPDSAAVLATLRQADRSLRYAEYRLTIARCGMEPGPDGRTLAEWAKNLRDRWNVVIRPAPIFSLIVAESPAHSAAFAERFFGGATEWHLGEEPPPIWIESQASPQYSEKLMSSALGLLLAAGGILWWLGRRSTWPEQLAILGGIGVVGLGPSTGWPLAILTLIGVSARLFWLAGLGIRHLLQWRRRWTAAPA